jgi:membrane complex biogenesis BtpA family protein
MQEKAFFANLFKPVIGMIHLLPLPGSAAYDGCGLGPVVEHALSEGRALEEGGVDAILLQNTGDLPAFGDGGPETIAYMAHIGTLLRQTIKTPLGVNILANGTESALSVAHAVGARFVRIKVYVTAVVGMGGITEGSAQRAQDFIHKIGFTDVEIAADVYDRTSRPLVDMPIEEAAVYASHHGRAHALVITGSSVPDSLERIRRVKTTVQDKPVYVGGGATAENIARFFQECDGVIVGSSVKRGPAFQGVVDCNLLKAFMDAADRARR